MNIGIELTLNYTDKHGSPKKGDVSLVHNRTNQLLIMGEQPKLERQEKQLKELCPDKLERLVERRRQFLDTLTVSNMSYSLKSV